MRSAPFNCPRITREQSVKYPVCIECVGRRGKIGGCDRRSGASWFTRWFLIYSRAGIMHGVPVVYIRNLGT